MNLQDQISRIHKLDESKRIIEFQNGFALAYEHREEGLAWRVVGYDRRARPQLDPLDRPGLSFGLV